MIKIIHEKHPFINYIKNRIYRQNKNFFMIIVGSTGSGKSYAALSIASLLNKKFSINDCKFKAIDFLKHSKELMDSQKVTKGKVIIWDEFGVEHNAREFMTLSNRVVNHFFQTSRSLNMIFIMTVPYLSYVDSATQKLAHCIVEMTNIDKNNKTSTMKVKFIQVNNMSGKMYPKYLRFFRNGVRKVMKKIIVSIPEQELIDEYEKNKRQYQSDKYGEMIIRLDKKEKKETEIELTPKQQELFDLRVKEGLDMKQVSERTGHHIVKCYERERAIKKKGIDIKKLILKKNPIEIPVLTIRNG